MGNGFSFAERTNWEMMQNRLTARMDELRRAGTALIDLTESNPTRCGFFYPKEKILGRMAYAQNLVYDPSPAGHLEARQAIAAYYRKKNFSVAPEQIFLCASTSEAYTFLFRLLANPGERILFPRPSYPLFEFLVGLNDIKMESYPLVYQQNSAARPTGWSRWVIDQKSLEAKIQSTTKAIVLVNPNNPTGSFIHPEELAGLNALCQKHRLALISDEVFLDYPFSENHCPLSFVENREALTFVLGGLSKALGLPQMKLSWIVVNGPPPTVRAATERLEIILDTYLSVNTPVQNAMAGWMDLQSDLTGEILERVRENRRSLMRSLMEFPDCPCLHSEGGWYAIMKLPPTHREDEWVLDFLNKDYVFVHPGYFFDFYDEPYIVMSLLVPSEQFQIGVERILNRIDETVVA